LMYIVEGEHPWRPELDVGGKDSLRPIDQEERSLPGGLGGGSPNGPQDGLALKLLVLSPLRTSVLARSA
jgi:hypothetical protein